MQILIAIVVGGIVGWLASILMKTSGQMGLLANIIVGMIGSALGHWLFGLLGIWAYRGIGSLIVSLLGAMLLIAVLRSFRIIK